MSNMYYKRKIYYVQKRLTVVTSRPLPWSGEVLCRRLLCYTRQRFVPCSESTEGVSQRWEKWQHFSEQQILKVLMNVIVFRSD